MRKKSEQQLAGLIKGCVPASTVIIIKVIRVARNNLSDEMAQKIIVKGPPR